MKVGDLVSDRRNLHHSELGIVLGTRQPGPELTHRVAFQRLVKVLWHNGLAQEVWSNQLEVINESR
jgi:hypothetical protein